jgi:hypothetical protein
VSHPSLAGVSLLADREWVRLCTARGGLCRKSPRGGSPRGLSEEARGYLKSAEESGLIWIDGSASCPNRPAHKGRRVRGVSEVPQMHDIQSLGVLPGRPAVVVMVIRPPMPRIVRSSEQMKRDGASELEQDECQTMIPGAEARFRCSPLDGKANQGRERGLCAATRSNP